MATFVFDMRPYLTNGYRRVGYTRSNLVFAYLPVFYLLEPATPAGCRRVGTARLFLSAIA